MSAEQIKPYGSVERVRLSNIDDEQRHFRSKSVDRGVSLESTGDASGEGYRALMDDQQVGNIRIGGFAIPFSKAKSWVAEYTSSGTTSDEPFAYPAYDCFEAGRNDPTQLTDADLLAPGLLNVPVKIRSYYDLQAVRDDLESALANEDLASPLVDIDDADRVARMIKPLYSVLDGPRRPWNVRATTLSKVLHRKRPESVVLHDRWIRACYAGEKGPVGHDKDRSWSDYMVAMTLAMQHDMRTQRDTFALLDKATGGKRLTHVRLLDIVAWSSKGKEPSEAAEES
ncbi:DUF6308 family protein [Mycolicibacterium sp. P1-18]|uniref:DUF6308 family protein n=1 Tax=Mycolicibacterium sp. P1-18 TaxID=2024615 RepID=UPI0011F3CF90|nr:DUF6308 family protein [Mycolicibacterium sp. P1-18]